MGPCFFFCLTQNKSKAYIYLGQKGEKEWHHNILNHTGQGAKPFGQPSSKSKCPLCTCQLIMQYHNESAVNAVPMLLYVFFCFARYAKCTKHDIVLAASFHHSKAPFRLHHFYHHQCRGDSFMTMGVETSRFNRFISCSVSWCHVCDASWCLHRKSSMLKKKSPVDHDELHHSYDTGQ